MSVFLELTDRGDHWLLKPVGSPLHHPLDQLAKTYDEVNRAIADENGPTGLIIDLSQCEWMDSSVVGALVRTSTRIRGRSGEAVLCSIPDVHLPTLRGLMLIENEEANRFWRAFPDQQSARDYLVAELSVM